MILVEECAGLVVEWPITHTKGLGSSYNGVIVTPLITFYRIYFLSI